MTISDGLSPAYILHTRKYRDTSLIVELLVRDEGRVSAVARGARGKRGRQQATWQPFTPLLISCFGRGELRTVKHAEFLPTGFPLTGDSLLLGIYANELLVRVLGKYEAVPGLFGQYQTLLTDLAGDGTPSVTPADTAIPEPRLRRYQDGLRRFELGLLDELGFGISFTVDAERGAAVQPDRYYEFVADEGFYPVARLGQDDTNSFPGEHLLAIAAGDFSSLAIDQSAKHITRLAFARLLGGKPLKSRELFQRDGYGGVLPQPGPT
jgi:DNA repair protein RecO (recombination protein O)